MKSPSGLAGLFVSALVAALVAFAVTALLGGPAPRAAPPAAPAPESAPPAVKDLQRDVARLRAEVEELRGARRTAPPPRDPAAGEPGAASMDGDGAGPVEEGPAEGALPATRGELEALIDRRLAERAGPAGSEPPPPPRRRLSIEEAGAEMGLSTVEIDAARRAYREAELEMITAVMGTADIEAVKEELRAARDDPDRKAALVQKAVGNVIRNLGKLATLEDRRDRELRNFLPPEKVKKLKGYDLKPVLADRELEDIMKEAFGR